MTKSTVDRRIINIMNGLAVSPPCSEAKSKLTQFTPRSLGQALRISGITPADITVLAIHLDRKSPRPS